MKEFDRKNPYMDFRNSVPFINLSGYIVKQPVFTDEMPVKSLKEYLFKKKFPSMINFKRLQYRILAEEYRNGRR